MDREYSWIMGKNCISEVLKVTPQRLVKVYTSQKFDDDPLYKELKKNKIPIEAVSKHDLEKMVVSESHQGYVASVKKRESVNVREFLEASEEKEKSVVLMVDSIFDPQNLGAIFRAAECFGVDLLIFSKNRGCELTPVVSKTSAGATELVPFARVSNLVETMALFQKGGFWSIAAEAREGSQSLYAFEVPKKVLLILGSEGKGIQPLLSKKSDFHLFIPMVGAIDSLNVSQAAAVFLTHLTR